ncbi:hypothetical protein [Methyloglobulus sp.]|uniref:hypothetical protein n=1 Tax=Methyloglobulus sp. TaxID=2518622 RepID=UPI0017DD352E|nr:hypothetical protein [Methyloglobulus sp.]
MYTAWPRVSASLGSLIQPLASLQAILDRLEALVGAVAGNKLLQPGAFEDVIDRRSAYPLKCSASWITFQQRVW